MSEAAQLHKEIASLEARKADLTQLAGQAERRGNITVAKYLDEIYDALDEPLQFLRNRLTEITRPAR